MFNKKIYMTYKKHIPKFVCDRWTNLNNDYKIDFSLDKDCVSFLKEHFNDYIANLFQFIPVGMYKADLWRLCKLYIHGGVYADVDLVPYLNIDTLDKNITFYSCLAAGGSCIFQAFMINFSKPKNPLILHFLLSFLMNNPYTYSNGPCNDMYNCIKYNLNNSVIVSDKKYDMDKIKINIIVGSSKQNNKNIDLHYFPKDVEHEIILKEHPYSDKFEIVIRNNILSVKRIDVDCGWGHNHSIDIVINSNESIYLFKETIMPNKDISTAHVTYKSQKILDSRDINYYKNKRW